MIIRCKNVYGDGTVEYKEYEVEEPQEEQDDEATESDYIDALQDLGVDVDA